VHVIVGVVLIVLISVVGSKATLRTWATDCCLVRTAYCRAV